MQTKFVLLFFHFTNKTHSVHDNMTLFLNLEQSVYKHIFVISNLPSLEVRNVIRELG